MAVNSVILTKDQKHMIYGGSDGIFKVYDIENKQEIFSSEKTHASSIVELALIEDEKKLVSVLNDGIINIYDFASKESLHSFGKIESNEENLMNLNF